MTHEKMLFVFSLFSVMGYLAGGLMNVFKLKKTSYVFAFSAWLLNFGIVTLHWVVNSYPPFASMYQVLSVLSLLFPIIGGLFTVFDKSKEWLFKFFVFAAAIPLIGTLFMENSLKWALMPALRSVFFVPHVFSYMISYSLAAVSFATAIRYFVLKNDRESSFDALVAITRISVPFMVNGLVLGAVWADQVWGNFWQWDVKEIWSLITSLLYLSGLHLACTKNKKTTVVIICMLGFIALIVTFLFVNVLPNAATSQHTYI